MPVLSDTLMRALFRGASPASLDIYRFLLAGFLVGVVCDWRDFFLG